MSPAQEAAGAEIPQLWDAAAWELLGILLLCSAFGALLLKNRGAPSR